MLEYATYSVISPEGCAAILWKDQDSKAEAAEAMRLTAPDLLSLGVVDGIIPEPVGRRAHRSRTRPAAGSATPSTPRSASSSACRRSELVARRYAKFRALGVYDEG